MFQKTSYFTILLFALAAITILMVALNGIGFLKLKNLKSMAFQLPELGILTLAMMIAMLTSGINLSIISTANLSGIVMAIILTSLIPPDSPATGGSVWVVLLALLVGIAVGALVGLLNGFLIAVLDISPILATLGTMIMLNGFAVVITKGYVISGFPPLMLAIGNKALFGVPIPMIIFLICAGVMAVILNRTPLGDAHLLVGFKPYCLFILWCR